MEKISPIKEKLLQYIDCKGIKKTEFCENTGISYANLKGSGLKSEIGGAQIGKILSFYQDINPEWLLTGNGEMLRSDQRNAHNDEQNRELPAKHSNDGIPLIPLDAFAGFGNSNSTPVIDYECEKYVIPDFKGAEFLIQVKGSSMYPKYSSGDIVACKKLALDTFFQWNKVYVLDTEQGILIKRIKPSEKTDHIMCVSDNEKYDPFELHKKDILSVAIVIGVIRLE